VNVWEVPRPRGRDRDRVGGIATAWEGSRPRRRDRDRVEISRPGGRERDLALSCTAYGHQPPVLHILKLAKST